MAVIVNTETCTGCRACELACSFHHRKVFHRNVSSIQVKRNEKEGIFTIFLYREPEDGHLACEGCDEGEQFCVSYCPVVARDELKAVLKAKEY